MNRATYRLFILLMTLGFLTAASQAKGQYEPRRVSDSAVGNLLGRLEEKTDRFKRNMNSALDQSRYDETDTEDKIFEYITQFENATDSLKQKFDADEAERSGVADILNRAVLINQFMKSHDLSYRVERDWRSLRKDLARLAKFYSVESDWNTALATGTTIYLRPYRVSDKSVAAVLSRIESRTDRYKRSMNRALDRSTLNDTDKEDMVFDYITAFENATDALKQKFDARESVSDDVKAVLTKAASVDAFMKRNELTPRAERHWRTIRTDLDVLASYYSVAFDWSKAPVDDRTLAYTVAGPRVEALLRDIETKADIYKRAMDTALDSSVLNGSKSEDAIVEYITAFENSTDRLRQRFEANESTDKDVEEVLSRAAYIDTFMKDYRLMRSAEREWLSLKADLDKLSGFYAVNWNWDRQYEPRSEFDAMITGTYRLNPALSDDVDKVVENTVRLYPKEKERLVEERLKYRLVSPRTIAIEKDGLEVALASSVAPKASFRADGIARSESTETGEKVLVSARTTFDGVSLSYQSDATEDFYVNFIRLDDGRLRVVRRIDLDHNNETLTIASVYEKVDPVAKFDAINDLPLMEDKNDGAFQVPNGTELTAVLTSAGISTKASKEGDLFTLEITSPGAYEGAVVSGRVVLANRSGLFTGRAKVSLDFDSILMKDGNTYKFSGLIENVTLASGEKVTVNNEGQVRDNNQAGKTAKRAGIGAGVGAIIGAIFGGGEGAAIGAAVGAGAGAGTVLAQGRDDVEIDKGSEFVITATAPDNPTGSY